MEKRRDFEHAAEEIEQLFADLWQVFPFSRSLRRGYRPEVDVYRSEDPPTLTVQVELPGVDPDDVQLVASPQALLIAGERRRLAQDVVVSFEHLRLVFDLSRLVHFSSTAAPLAVPPERPYGLGPCGRLQ